MPDIKALAASLRDITPLWPQPTRRTRPGSAPKWRVDITYQQDSRVIVESRPRLAESGVGEASRRWTTRMLSLWTTFAIG